MSALWKPPPIYTISGDFFERNFIMKDSKDHIVAKGSKDLIQMGDDWNSYQVQVAAGMDAVLAIACLVAIDEEMDEEHKAAREKKQRERE